MTEVYYKNESYKIMGACMDVHNHLDPGSLEIVYKDALEHEFYVKDIPFEREKEYIVNSKGTIFSNKFYANFVFLNN